MHGHLVERGFSGEYSTPGSDRLGSGDSAMVALFTVMLVTVLMTVLVILLMVVWLLLTVETVLGLRWRPNT